MAVLGGCNNQGDRYGRLAFVGPARNVLAPPGSQGQMMVLTTIRDGPALLDVGDTTCLLGQAS